MSQAGAASEVSPSVVTETLTGNSGGAVPPTANNINTVGTGSIAIVGNPGTSTLTTQLTGLTPHNVLIGAGTATITNVVPSITAGIPLISNGAAVDPSFGKAVVAGGGTGDTSFTPYSVICGGTTATGDLQNVSGLGTAGQILTSNGAAALPTWQLSPSSSTYFQAYLTSPQSVAGGDSAYTIVFDTAIANVGSAYNTGTGIFTAPATGYYSFAATVYFNGLTMLAANTQTLLGYTGSVQSLRLIQQGVGAYVSGVDIIFTVSWAMPMTAGDTVKLQPFADGTGNYQIFGSALSSGAFNTSSTFSGYRVA